MMPPECALCEKSIRNSDGEFELVYFKETKEDEEWHKRAGEEPGFVGHPPNAVWFCKEHHKEAEKLENKTKTEALKILREKFKS